MRLGFTQYVFMSVDRWDIDPNDRTAVRAALAGTIADIDAKIAQARALGIPIALSILDAIRDTYDPAQAASEVEDIRNMQWYSDARVAAGWWTHSRYARKQLRLQEAYMRELGRVLADRMHDFPDTLVAAAGDGEVEMANPLQGNDPVLADYSPFTIAEFRDWLRNGGLYASGQPFAGQAYALASRYAGDASPATDTNGDGHTLNGDFGTSFTTWSLLYFDWSVSDAFAAGDPHAIPKATQPRFPSLDIVANPNGFDAPRDRFAASLTGKAKDWAQLWRQFREVVIWRHNRAVAEWITTSVSDAGATVPASRWFSYQIPSDYLFGLTRDNHPNPRLETSASSVMTADVSPFGSLGVTAFNITSTNAAAPGGYLTVRTLAAAVPEIVQRSASWGILEWHPCLNGDSANPGVPVSILLGVCRAEMDLIVQYRPRLLAPFAWRTSWSPIEGGPFETALRELVARLNQDRQSDPRLDVNAPADGGTVSGPFTISGWAADLGNRGADRGTGVDAVQVSAQKIGEAAVSLGQAQYGVSRPDVAAALGAQFTASGFSLAVAAGVLAPGQYRLDMSARSTLTNTFVVTKSVTITVLPPTPEPYLRLDAPSNGASLTQGAAFTVSGWGIDKGATSGIGIDAVTVYAVRTGQPQISLGAATLGGSRPDIGRLFGGQFTNSGFMLTVAAGLQAGTYQITAFGHSTLSNAFSVQASAQVTVTAPVSAPLLRIDGPTNGGTSAPSLTMAGWTIDRGATLTTGVDDVVVYGIHDGVQTPLGHATLGVSRPDIGAAFGSQFATAGFTLNVSNLAVGTWALTAYSHSTISGNYTSSTVTVTVVGPHSEPVIRLDGPNSNSTVGRRVTVAGWAIDHGAASGTGVDAIHVYALPTDGSAGQFLGVATYGLARPDVGAAVGSPFTNSGFRLSATVTPPGKYRIVAFARSTVAGAFNSAAAAENVTVQSSNTNAVLFVDTPGANTTQARPFTIAGWTVDPGADTGTGIEAVDVWAFAPNGAGTYLGAGTYGSSRPDIAELFGDARFNDSGFTLTIGASTLAAGTYSVVVFGKSTVTGGFTVARVVPVTVQ